MIRDESMALPTQRDTHVLSKPELMFDDVGVCTCAREAKPASFLAAALQLTGWSLCSMFSPRNLTQVTSTMKPGQDSMFGFSSVKRITLREGLY